MAVTINSSTTSGMILTSDVSGVTQIQANNVTLASFDNTSSNTTNYIQTTTIKSKLANTAPLIVDGNGTEVGKFAKAWAYFNGVSTITIYNSFNISSIIRTGTGNYTINFTNGFANSNYSTIMTAAYPGTAFEIYGVQNQSTNSFTFSSAGSNGTSLDSSLTALVVFS
jgi:hypothetical protein